MSESNTEHIGKQQKFMLLYEPVNLRFNVYALAMCGNGEDAKDLVSDTVLLAFEKLEKLRNDDVFLYFLLGIARRIYLKQLRKNKRSFSSTLEEFAKKHLPEAPADAALEAAYLYKAIQQLPEKQRETVILAELEDLSLKEIRQIQGGTLSGVKSRLKRGKETLAKLLTDKETDIKTKTSGIFKLSKAIVL